jgi:predicted enzyme related to lactoylglutathione lyase
MTTLSNLVDTVRAEARAAQAAATETQAAVTVALAPVVNGLAETQHEVDAQGADLTRTMHDVTDAGYRVETLEATVDTLIIDILTGGGML